MAIRLDNCGIFPERPVNNTIYTMLQHNQSERNPQRYEILINGLNEREKWVKLG